MTDVIDGQTQSTDSVLRQLEGGVLTITLNRPEAANALRPDDRNELIRLFEEAGGDPDVRVVVLRANGRHFCAGADVLRVAGDRATKVKRVTGAMYTIMTGAQRLIASVLDCPKPVVSVVQGAAAGIGAHLAYASDLVVVSENAYFAESFVKRGLVVDGGGAYLLPRRIGMQRAKEMVFFGEKLSARDALDLGLVNRVVPVEELDSTTEEFTSRLAVAPTSSIALTKRLFNDSPDVDRTQSFVAEAMAQEIQGYSQDSKEGVQAFVEKRDADYVGW
ncbi:2-(1,2-epoxy-1,2-dihydrophenyl)acetyl-CoA isomerase [Rhodococcus rhodochrous J3]|uniref:2-(1,2-epoxy-1,2-dihydrophenyl)acetyl-CoA isomerase n=1 Tax=Rhodococcus rhodochrous J3 TaxID=903528 RepID=A0ABY1MIV2_RHORH|nr:enoyl-CoA hydratase-related protein [Rhodococcus rhodochrous]MCD2099346.1 enoyl-CoA hydratase-related protein [Rhodococcus rhodochrous]MCD2123649.1 enoyl-CoA hydratase-related protein [Rhodococcus rhodochrous]MCQ4136322.1 enoyl-CoA hydratase-related protein [Rhodococcus rhodochrous]MDJ0020445.1 enoyl-CoA hydratase-related protein [Rhodococcus rhodochrous]SMG58479.1 2-(1,2-epoxy-1,2-dihydrophenyl)acetyl-CoA isomerase [Rhodococcus rhodochrous J3]